MSRENLDWYFDNTPHTNYLPAGHLAEMAAQEALARDRVEAESKVTPEVEAKRLPKLKLLKLKHSQADDAIAI
ncbi:MAG TPA: hypothetical protein VI953_01840 [Candidatus Paceibacterota bacterium]|uniref:Uncharacterized protein n=1 Tax=Candidatus Wildermuthbacteria bacterium RIFCSPHIGHO2_01_FULL_49_22b TaxID=1802448 RepID=A0A1G2QYA1_9BACT|nr:MAG: hypothetical protein A2672_00515 [Candidatus Wildermuthbacteria bacterium RIFCSPHIGHO2_01_FULL_49_22b]